MAATGQAGRKAETTLAVYHGLSVAARIALACRSMAVMQQVWEMAVLMVVAPEICVPRKAAPVVGGVSASSTIWTTMVFSAPQDTCRRQSPESITSWLRQKTALATSETSARVGRGLRIMESSIWVAMITGLPRPWHLRIICF